ncbi:bifunctional 4-hydroxy-2-oxoglutarate aldolase/2-dehydro-3-deoxy-phosphogluconate aldolase [Metabacillus litoralis]|uniref:Bifunctional 4-hydroxy-2-oxoglutarate aldolase/2-dehydro-3-deoxy-phosphogluconate aldolase n=1 Tax=Metabacillus litoralis TaxID=152268 RepID=A0A5C6W2Q7_9BACI|nr:bifunctional 4-hydroxy-2-oxoglutarate aldolase/2-dehydro-3-deoxy-phosphogluconate aldolase [Metabacillus litoralis]TXC90594.1 bifunctional 4-hydroxy-2-oxoglutarate aldolase/2-dehydro-3-deoxy-phosphogluconate aldolase [Metabacillus litoralis]
MGHIEIIKQTGVAAVIRGATVDNIALIGEALSKGGVKVLEITVETPGACAAIEKASLELNDVLVGAGTVLDPETARTAIMSGAKFIFSPTINSKTIEMAKRYGVVSIPGALTPTEILSAYENGADLVKVFPANVFGPSYIKDIHGPLPQIPLITTGGISVANVGEYIKAGASGVGVGSSLVNTKKELSEQYLSEITETASAFIKAVQDARKK